jgi:acetylornithine/succinyldiaminopimelate/putrescine aminotransferase
MLVFDESMRRAHGKMFYCEHDGVVPDLMALGKGFGGGVMPIGATVGTAKTWEKYIENPFLHTTTFGGNPVCCAAAIATINVLLEENLPQQAAEKGDYMLKHINALAGKYPKVLKLCRGKGLMLGMEFADHDLGYEVADLSPGKSSFPAPTSTPCIVRHWLSVEIIDRFHKALKNHCKPLTKLNKP